VLSILELQLTVELVKCTLLLNRLLVLHIYCCALGVSNVVTEQRLRVSPAGSDGIVISGVKV